MLTNNHQADAKDAVQSADLRLAVKVVYQKHRYVISEDVDAQEIVKATSKNKYLKQGHQGIICVESETYYVFQRIH